MTTTMWGSDPDELEAAAAELMQSADVFEQSGKGLRGTLYNVLWKGRFSDEFRVRWDGHHMPSLTTTSGFLREMAEQLRRNAAEQRNASRGGPSTGPGTLPGHTPRANPSTQPGGQAPQTNPPASRGGGTSPYAGMLTGSDADLRNRFTAAWENHHPYDQWGFTYNPSGDCTSYVAWRLNDLAHQRGLDWSMANGHYGTAHPAGGSLGNAETWGDRVPHDTTPKPGSVAWWPVSGHTKDGEPYGHVAIVRSVDPATHAITIEESSWGSVVAQTRTLAPGDKGYPTGFLHLLPDS